jgi:peptidoglycan-N-acetylglucosamine deacetylase
MADAKVPYRVDARRKGADMNVQIRRRRTTAVTCLSLAMVLLVLLVTSAGGSRHGSSDSRAAPPAGARSGDRRPSRSGTGLQAREDGAIDRLLARQPFISAGGGERREIALTFDDGPGPYTPKLLDELQRLHVPATFFEIGFMFQWFTIPLAANCEWAT